MRKRWFITLMIPAVIGAVVVMRRDADRNRSQVATNSAVETRHQPVVRGASAFDRLPRWSASEPLALAEPQASGSHDLANRSERLAESAPFRDFAEKAQLDERQRRTIAHILALYYENKAALEATASEDDHATSMYQQLLGDTVAQLRARLSDSAWDAFARSGLLADVSTLRSDPT